MSSQKEVELGKGEMIWSGKVWEEVKLIRY